tara:strand:+ start:1385 stop:1552 length:168 start_codon:yes stop_codon:yes gene_type:complete
MYSLTFPALAYLKACSAAGHPTIEQEEFRMPYVNIKITDDNWGVKGETVTELRKR